MEQNSSRWNEITPSSLDHEKAALAYIRDLLPDRSPYQAWSNFRFLSDQGACPQGRPAGRRLTGLFLIEIRNFRWGRPDAELAETAAASGPRSDEQIGDITGLDAPGASAVAKHLVDDGWLITTGQRRGMRYLPAEQPAG